MNRYKGMMKTKRVHGVRTGQHNNPHVMKAARRANGGPCDGEAAPKNLGRMGRMKKADGGPVDWQAGGRALSGLSGLGMGAPGQQMQAPVGPPDSLSETQRAGQQLMNMSALGMRKDGGKVGRAGGGAVSEEDAKRMAEGSTTGTGGSMVGRPIKKADGGAVAAKHLKEDLDEHAMEHKLLAKREGRKDGGALSTKERNALPGKSFALPGRRYPINDPNHARNALSRVSQHGSPEEKSKVRGAVHRKYPGIGEKEKD